MFSCFHGMLTNLKQNIACSTAGEGDLEIDGLEGPTELFSRMCARTTLHGWKISKTHV